MSTVYFCCQNERRDRVFQDPVFNGINYLEVLDGQCVLAVHFFKPPAVPLATGNIVLTGGERLPSGDPINGVVVTAASLDDADPVVLNVEVNRPGDFSIYTLGIVSAADNSAPPPTFDPLLSTVDFSFKVECPSDFDCATTQVCPAVPQVTPDIDYLAKDYTSFRQLMLDRMAALLPNWQERNIADMGVMLVELLAYIGDDLSYQQDSVATEAYLGTAQRRVSVRRHARLVDYYMHDGCNARVWIQVLVQSDVLLLPKGTQFLTAAGVPAGSLAPGSALLAQALRAQPEVFESLADAQLFQQHCQMEFYTWGNTQCCLPLGATKAVLAGDYPNLQAGDVLIFQEVLGPLTGQPEDADPTHRQAVRLSQPPVRTFDPLYGTAITEIEWYDDDKLTFPLCLSSVANPDQQAQTLLNVSIALGNIVLADHGQTIPDEILLDDGVDAVPAETIFRAPASTGDCCTPATPVPVPPRFNPTLQSAPLTMAGFVQVAATGVSQLTTTAAPFDPGAAASAAFAWDLADVLPAISLNDDTWHPLYDLLSCGPADQNFVAEVSEDGFATLRFGDGEYGLRPQPGDVFTASYRLGNGTAGNVGAESIVNIVNADLAITGVINPLPASGGVDPEAIEHVRQSAPSAFRTQERAVTPADYAAIAERYPGVQQAAATFRWTGSWRTVSLTIDRLGGLAVDAAFKSNMLAWMDIYRMAGQDLEVDGPLYVSLEIALTVCVQADYMRSDVEGALRMVFSNRVLPDGTLGVFHPDNFSFGQAVYLSSIYAAALRVTGVAAVKVTTFQRQETPDPAQTALLAGMIPLGRLEIARLDNDPNFPEHGVFTLDMEDGK